MRGLKESLVSGVVNLVLSMIGSAIWGGMIGLILFATGALATGQGQTWDQMAYFFAVCAATITFIYETPLVRWLFRFFDGLHESAGTVALLFVVPASWLLFLGRIVLSLIPVKLLLFLLKRINEKQAAICQFAGVVISNKEVQIDDNTIPKGAEIFRITQEWKIQYQNSCWGWIDRKGRIYKDASVAHKSIDPNLHMNTHPSGHVDENIVHISNAEVGTLNRR